MDRVNLTNQQSDYAVYLPALSSFYTTILGKQKEKGNYVEQSRIPQGFENGVEGLDYLNKDKGYFHYKWSLYSAGHANMDLDKDDSKDWMVRHRDRDNTLIVGDSGGFQIAKGVWEGNWADPTDKMSEKRRSNVLKWLDEMSDYAMTLDVPTWVTHDKVAGKKVGIKTYADCINTTLYNNEYFIRNRNGGAKFLNVLQGSNFKEADDWYSHVKKFNDPKQYPNEHFNGWAMGGNNMSEIHLILRRLVELRYDGLLEKGVHDWMHFLGVAKLDWGCMLTDIQRAVRKYHNPNWTASMDAASPFLATANGKVYKELIYKDRGNWTYRMDSGPDDKKYCNDTRNWADGIEQDGIFESMIRTPISDRTMMKDICTYAPGDLNKIGKEGATSWDSFSYGVQMAHNVYAHIHAVQEANRRYDAGAFPSGLIKESATRIMFRDIVEEVFSTDSKDKALDAIEEYDRFYLGVRGTRGLSGKKSINSHSQFRQLFEVVEDDDEEEETVENGLDGTKLDALEGES